MDKLNNNSFQKQHETKAFKPEKQEKEINLFFDKGYNNNDFCDNDSQYISALLERQISIMKKINRNCG